MTPCTDLTGKAPLTAGEREARRGALIGRTGPAPTSVGGGKVDDLPLRGLAVRAAWGEGLTSPSGAAVAVMLPLSETGDKPRAIAAGDVFVFAWQCECGDQRLEQFMLKAPDGWPRLLTAEQTHELGGRPRATNLETLYGRGQRQREIRKAAAKGPLETQQTHSPVAPVMVEVSRTTVPDGKGGLKDVRRTLQQGWRRDLDRRLVESLTEPQRFALEELGDLLAVVCRGQSSTLADLDRVDGGGSAGPEGKLDAIQRVAEWERACRAERVNPEVARLVVQQGMSFSGVNRQYGKRKQSWARDQFRACLDVRARQRGWLGRPTG